MTAKDKFEKAKGATETLQTVRNHVKEVRDSDVEILHSEQSRENVSDVITFLDTWEEKLQDEHGDVEDLEKLREARAELAVFEQSPNQSDVETLAEDLKTLYYTMVAHTTVLYVQKEKEDTLHRDDDRTFQ